MAPPSEEKKEEAAKPEKEEGKEAAPKKPEKKPEKKEAKAAPKAPEAGKEAAAKKGPKLPKGRHLSAIKRHRQNLKRQARNTPVEAALKTAVRKVRKALTQKDAAVIQKSLREAVSLFAKAAAKGIVHPRNASRHIARLSKSVRSFGGGRQGEHRVSP